MKIDEMFERVLLKSGQFIMAKTKVEIDVDSFRMLVEDAIAQYNKTSPYHAQRTIEIFSPRQWDFSQKAFNQDYPVPDWISECTPIRFNGLSLNAFNINSYASQSSELVDPIQAPWDWNKPVLTVPFSSSYKIVACFKHRITLVEEESTGGKKVYEIKTISYEDNLFFELLKGMFLQGIGRSRRAFTMSDLPITMDADAIASEGEAIIASTKEELAQQSKFWLAMG